MTLLNALEQSGCQTALAGLEVMKPSDWYADEQLRLCLVLLSAWGVLRISHINDQPIEEWGVPLDTARRPDGDTLDQYLNRLIELDEADSPSSVTDRLGQIRSGGRIDTAQQESLRCWAEAGLLEGTVWYFDDHVVEYTGQADLGKTKHGTKHISVKAVNRYTLSNGLCSLSESLAPHAVQVTFHSTFLTPRPYATWSAKPTVACPPFIAFGNCPLTVRAGMRSC